MKPGDRIGIGNKGGREVHLFCEVVGSNDYGMSFRVINGAWDGILQPNGTVVAMRGMEIMSVVPLYDVLYTGPLPALCRHDYNAAIEYMNDQLQKPRIALWWASKRYRMGLVVGRFKEACRAFCDVWQGKTSVDVEDTIPF